MHYSRPLRLLRVSLWLVCGTALAGIPGFFAWQERSALTAATEEQGGEDEFDGGSATATDLLEKRDLPQGEDGEGAGTLESDPGPAGPGDADEGDAAEEPDTAAEPPADEPPADEPGDHEAGEHEPGEHEPRYAPPRRLPDEIVDGAAQPPQDEPLAEVEAARFQGIQPGVSTVVEIDQAWGQPLRVGRRGSLVEHVYQLEGAEAVTVTYDVDVVTTIVVDLARPLSVKRLEAELELEEIEEVPVHDEAGALVGQAYPERGVLFSFSTPPQVAQVIMEAPSAPPFVLRAERLKDERYAACLRDVAHALQIDPLASRAWWLKAHVLAQLGQQTPALEAAHEAVRLEPEEPRFALTLGQILEQSGQYVRAAGETKRAISLASGDPALRALALCQLGRQIAAGPARDYQRAVDYHLQAIRTAVPLVTDHDPRVRQAAHQALLEAHLAVANGVAWGNWSNKEEVVNKWLAKAQTIADELAGQGPSQAHFQVCTQALAAQVGLQGKADPKSWTLRAQELGSALIEATPDELSRRDLEWRLGLALYDALQVLHMRGQYGLALKYGQQAAEYLDRGAQEREDLAGFGYLMGRLYFRIGVIHAIHNRDHDEAVAWFTKAVPLVEQPIPQSALGDVGRQGETLVSMAISFWETGNRREALRLTSEGTKLMEQAVEEQILPASALGVAYGNLSHMHQELGQADAAKRYERMAVRSREETRR